jgi:hypothetical protein
LSLTQAFPGIRGFRLENNVMVTEGEPEIYNIYPFDDRLLGYPSA